MAAQAGTTVVIAPEEAFLLARLHGAGNTPARVAQRSRLLLVRDLGYSLGACARSVGCTLSTVKRLCHRFQEQRLQAIYDALRSGAPPRYSQETKDFSCTLVRQGPAQAGLPISRWSLHWLRVAATQYRWPQVPSREQLRRWLQAARLPWHRHRSWETSDDPRFWEKLERLWELYAHPDPDLLVLAFDEKPQTQALARRLPDRHPLPGHPRQRQHQHERHGIVNFFAIQRLRDGRVSCGCYDKGTATTLGQRLARYLRRQPQSRIAVILDNASVHLSARFLEAAQQSGKEIELAFTPTYSSWANSAEWFLNHRQRDLIALASLLSREALIGAIRAYRDLYNRVRATPVRMPGLGRYLARACYALLGPVGPPGGSGRRTCHREREPEHSYSPISPQTARKVHNTL
jgi:transposase